jgi:hypothetical protein
MSHDGSTLADTRWRHPAVTRSDYRRPAQRGESGRWAQQLRADLGSGRRRMASTCIRTCSSSAPGAGLLRPGRRRADRNGEFWGYPERRPFAELVIDSEEDLVLRAVLARGAT